MNQLSKQFIYINRKYIYHNVMFNMIKIMITREIGHL